MNSNYGSYSICIAIQSRSNNNFCDLFSLQGKTEVDCPVSKQVGGPRTNMFLYIHNIGYIIIVMVCQHKANVLH